MNGGPGLNIRGAAGGPYIVRASNFAPGTTAADIESVMANVSGHMTYCKLVASTPTVIAEMSFPDRTGADAVIEVFNNHRVWNTEAVREKRLLTLIRLMVVCSTSTM